MPNTTDEYATLPMLAMGGRAALALGGAPLPDGGVGQQPQARRGGAGRGQGQAQARELARRRDTFTRLMAAAIPATEGIIPGPGILPYAHVPRQIRDLGGAMIGWDEARLKPDERMMLAQLIRLGDMERRNQQMGPTAPASGGATR